MATKIILTVAALGVFAQQVSSLTVNTYACYADADEVCIFPMTFDTNVVTSSGQKGPYDSFYMTMTSEYAYQQLNLINSYGYPEQYTMTCTNSGVCSWMEINAYSTLLNDGLAGILCKGTGCQYTTVNLNEGSNFNVYCHTTYDACAGLEFWVDSTSSLYIESNSGACSEKYPCVVNAESPKAITAVETEATLDFINVVQWNRYTPSPTAAPTKPTGSPTLKPTADTKPPTPTPTGNTKSPTPRPTKETLAPTSRTAAPTRSPVVTGHPTEAPTPKTASPTGSPTRSTKPPSSETKPPTKSTPSPTSKTASPTKSTSSPTSGSKTPTVSPTNFPTTPSPTRTDSNGIACNADQDVPCEFPMTVLDCLVEGDTSKTAWEYCYFKITDTTFSGQEINVITSNGYQGWTAVPCTVDSACAGTTMTFSEASNWQTGDAGVECSANKACVDFTAVVTTNSALSMNCQTTGACSGATVYVDETSSVSWTAANGACSDEANPCIIYAASGSTVDTKPGDGDFIDIREWSQSPTPAPTASPTVTDATNAPTRSPTVKPTASPIKSPTVSPTQSPTTSPIKSPTNSPTEKPVTSAPTSSPTSSPTMSVTDMGTASPTESRSESPTKSPTQSPTESPVVADGSTAGGDDENNQDGDANGDDQALSGDGGSGGMQRTTVVAIGVGGGVLIGAFCCGICYLLVGGALRKKEAEPQPKITELADRRASPSIMLAMQIAAEEGELDGTTPAGPGFADDMAVEPGAEGVADTVTMGDTETGFGPVRFGPARPPGFSTVKSTSMFDDDELEDAPMLYAGKDGQVPQSPVTPDGDEKDETAFGVMMTPGGPRSMASSVVSSIVSEDARSASGSVSVSEDFYGAGPASAARQAEGGAAPEAGEGFDGEDGGEGEEGGFLGTGTAGGPYFE